MPRRRHAARARGMGTGSEVGSDSIAAAWSDRAPGVLPHRRWSGGPRPPLAGTCSELQVPRQDGELEAGSAARTAGMESLITESGKRNDSQRNQRNRNGLASRWTASGASTTAANARCIAMTAASASGPIRGPSTGSVTRMIATTAGYNAAARASHQMIERSRLSRAASSVTVDTSTGWWSSSLRRPGDAGHPASTEVTLRADGDNDAVDRVIDDDHGASVAHAADPLEIQRVIPTRDLAHAFCQAIRGDDRDRRDESVKIRDTDRQLGDVTLCREHTIDRPRPRLIGRTAAGARRREQDGKDHVAIVAPGEVCGSRAGSRQAGHGTADCAHNGSMPKVDPPRPFRRRATRRRPSSPTPTASTASPPSSSTSACSPPSPTWATRSRRRSSARRSRCCSPVATSWPRRRPAPARPRRSRCRSSSASRSAQAGPNIDERPRRRADPRARDAGRRGVPRLRQVARRAGRARLRRPADRAATARPAPRRRCRRRDAGSRGRPPQARQPELRRGAHRRARRGGRDARHGLRRGPRHDPVGHARATARPRSSRRRSRRRSRGSPSATCATRPGSRSTPRSARPTASRASARPPTSCGGSTSCRRCAASSTSRIRRPRSSSRGPAARWTTWPRR